MVPVLIKCIAEGDALPTGGLQSAFSSVTALLDAAKAADPKTSMLEASVAAELLQKGLLAALKVAVRGSGPPSDPADGTAERRRSENSSGCSAGCCTRRFALGCGTTCRPASRTPRSSTW